MAEPGAEYRVRLPIFEGPFDLLLHLVKINEMEITDISLAMLTKQYLVHLQQMVEMDLDVAGDFLVVAATLMQIKARYLLPRDQGEEEEEEEEIDELLSARELLQQLIEYRSYKEIVAELQHLEERSQGVYYRSKLPEFFDPRESDDSIQSELDLLFKAMANVLRFIEKRDPHTSLYEKYTVEDKIEFLSARLMENRELNIVKEFEQCLNKIEVIVTFLALLELVRLRRVKVQADDNAENITLYAVDVDDDDESLDVYHEDMNRNEQEETQETE